MSATLSTTLSATAAPDTPDPSPDDPAANPLLATDPESVIALFGLTLLFVIAFFSILTIPRLLVLLRHRGSVFKKGWMLKPKKSAAIRARNVIQMTLFVPPVQPTSHPTIKGGLVTEAAPHAAYGADSGQGHETAVGTHSENIRTLVRHYSDAPSAGAPAHVPSWSALLHPFSAWFARPFFDTGLSNGRAIIYSVYAVAFITVAFIKSAGVDMLQRAGWLVVAQTPLVIALGTKNSLVGFFVGQGYEKVLYFFSVYSILLNFTHPKLLSCVISSTFSTGGWVNSCSSPLCFT